MGAKIGTEWSVLVLGLVTGVAFGSVLFKVGASQYDQILGMLRLRNMRILKFMITAVITASVGIYMLHGTGIIDLTIKPVWLLAQITGGGLFGIGFALLGYCPGTAVVAMGEGKRDALVGVLGGIVGAALFAHWWPQLSGLIVDGGRLTLPGVLGVSNWSGVGMLVVVFLGVLGAVEWWERAMRARRHVAGG